MSAVSEDGVVAGKKGATVAVRVSGPLAVFTHPALKAERVTYPVMTPSAARGILEAVLWKPAISWRIERISVLSPIRFTSFRRNEVNSKAAVPAAAVVREGGPTPLFFADDRAQRNQRNSIALCKVDYVIEAHFILTDRAGPDDNIAKFTDMFRRRVERGQHFHQPYLGCREFVADVRSADGAPQPIDDTRDIGRMLLDIRYSPSGNRPVFFDARLERGVLSVPTVLLGGGAS